MDETKKWVDVWRENYTNASPLSKVVMDRTKPTYKGDRYIPWALLVGALYQLDPDAKITKLENEFEGAVFTDSCQLRTIKEGVETMQTVLSHFVKVRVTFMGKVFEESYPIQDNDYSASKVYDQNKVNKAQQRCLARLISLATGIGWALYEQSEAQFEDDKNNKPQIVAPIIDTGTMEAPSEVLATPSGELSVIDEIVSLFNEFKTHEGLNTLLTNFNAVLKTKYTDADGAPLELNINDAPDVCVAKLGRIDKPDKMLKSLRKVVGR